MNEFIYMKPQKGLRQCMFIFYNLAIVMQQQLIDRINLIFFNQPWRKKKFSRFRTAMKNETILHFLLQEASNTEDKFLTRRPEIFSIYIWGAQEISKIYIINGSPIGPTHGAHRRYSVSFIEEKKCRKLGGKESNIYTWQRFPGSPSIMDF